MISIGQISSAYNQIKPILEDEIVKRYGNALLKIGKDGAKKIIGHIETTRKAANQGLLTANGNSGGVSKLLSGNMSGAVQQISKIGAGSLGGLTSLGWANLAVSGINLGVTAVGMIVVSKKIDTLTSEVQQMNSRLDGIIEEMHQIKAGIVQLNDNEIRKLYREANQQIRRMKNYSSELSYDGKYNDNLRREVNGYLSDASVFLEDILGRYEDSNCDIALGLDVIMAHFYTFVSLMKSYISVVYLHDKDLLGYGEYENTLRNMCSKYMVETIQNVYRQSTNSFVSPQDLGLITSVYKGIMIEQISEIKSQRQILELIDYNDYRRINEQLQNSSESGEISLIQYN